MRDLDFLRDKPPLPSLVVYRYRTETLRRAVFAHIHRTLLDQDQKLIGSTPDLLWRRLNGGGLFDQDDTALFIDWSVFALRSSVAERRLTTDESEPDDDLDYYDLRLSSVLRRARARVLKSTPIVVFVNAQDEDIGGSQSQASADEITINGTDSIARRDLSLLIGALAPGSSKSDVEELGRLAGRLWESGISFASLCETLESAAVSAKTRSSDTLSMSASAGRSAAHLSIRVLRDIVFGSQSARLKLVTALATPHGSGMDALRALLLATLKLWPVANASDADDKVSVTEDAVSWMNWLLTVLRHAEALGTSSTQASSLWPIPDRRAQVMLQVLEDYGRIRAQGEAGWQERLDLLESGASWLFARQPNLSRKTRETLRHLVPQANTFNMDGQDGHQTGFLLALDHWLQNDVRTQNAEAERAVVSVRLSSLDQLVGQPTLKSFFVRYFDARRADPRAYARPILLLGPDGVGKRRAADLMARLFVCETATALFPTQCGACDGCLNAAATIAEIDAEILTADAVIGYLRDRVRNRGTMWGSAVTVVYNVDRLSIEQTEEMLKSVEATFGTGLKIFTSRDRQAVHQALRSRCWPIQVWPLRDQKDT